ncbi:MAG TPA: hypothetical protein VIM98_18555 [Dyella sp.]|uniref:bestrophin-like domain n=1 Tax=Dyella sp. TaxID=1869338 RepID=UPI002F937A5F
MDSILISMGVFAVAWAGLWLGAVLANRMPRDHLSADTRTSAQIGINMMATLTALVLGFMITSARSSFDHATDDVVEVSTSIVMLDRALSGYGKESEPERDQLRAFLARATARVAPDGRVKQMVFRVPVTNVSLLTQLQQSILNLKPANDAQRWFQARALTLSGELSRQRVATSEQSEQSVPAVLLLIVSAWVVLIFVGLGAFTVHNRSVRVVLVCSALAFAGSVFLILEFETPYSGIIRVSGQPLLNAAEELSH